MPKTAIYKDDNTLLREGKIRTAEETRLATPATDPMLAKNSQHRNLSCFVAAAPDSRHDLRPLSGREYVGHNLTSGRGFRI
jgi:hypothetical protein